MNEIARKMLLEKIDQELKDIPHKFGLEDISITLKVTLTTKEGLIK